MPGWLRRAAKNGCCRNGCAGDSARMTPDDLRASPGLYPQKFDPEKGAVHFTRVTEAGYQGASFLDERLQGANSIWVPFGEVEQAMSRAPAGLPLHFIFHTGHVGSTLLSRLVDEAGGVL